MRCVEEGDFVNVSFLNSNTLFNVEVLYIPKCVGDGWRLRDADGKIYVVVLFERMDVIKKNIDHIPDTRKKVLPPKKDVHGFPKVINGILFNSIGEYHHWQEEERKRLGG